MSSARATLALTTLAALAWLGAMAGCTNGSPSPGAACAVSGGVCESHSCADSLPQFDCGEGQYCCAATTDAGSGG